MRKSYSFVTLVLGACIGAAGLSLVNTNLHAADDNRQQRMDQDKWTNADYARDAVDHLKKAEQEMHRVAESENSKVAKDGAKMCSEARAKVDEYIAEVQKNEKKK